MRIYLDNCCFNRPFDDQNQVRVRLEAEAKLYVQKKIVDKEIEFAWSYILDYENMFNPYEERREAIQSWKQKAVSEITESNQIIKMSESFMKTNIKPKDALHLACAVAGNCDYFLTTDDMLLSKKNRIKEIIILNPLDYIQIIK
ncbi:MAG: PIN domain protein [Bacteroidota bacterium]